MKADQPPFGLVSLVITNALILCSLLAHHFWPVPMDRGGKRRRVLDALGSVRSVNRSAVLQVLRCLEPESDVGLYDVSKTTRALTTGLIQDIAVEPVTSGGPATVAIARAQEELSHILRPHIIICIHAPHETDSWGTDVTK